VRTPLRIRELKARRSDVNNLIEEQVLKVKDQVFAFAGEVVQKLDLSSSSLEWEILNWNKKYTYRKYITFNGNIFMVGLSYFWLAPSKVINMDEFVRRSAEIDSYNSASGKWTALARMDLVRTNQSLVSFLGRICVLGGNPNTWNVECYNPNTNKWFYLPPANITYIQKIQRPAAVQLNNELFVIEGGTYDHLRPNIPPTIISSVVKYNPVNQTWKEVASLNHPRMGHYAGVFNGTIYVVGGDSRVVEIYDPSKNVWKIVDTLDVGTDAVYTVF